MDKLELLIVLTQSRNSNTVSVWRLRRKSRRPIPVYRK